MGSYKCILKVDIYLNVTKQMLFQTFVFTGVTPNFDNFFLNSWKNLQTIKILIFTEIEVANGEHKTKLYVK